MLAGDFLADRKAEPHLFPLSIPFQPLYTFPSAKPCPGSVDSGVHVWPPGSRNDSAPDSPLEGELHRGGWARAHAAGALPPGPQGLWQSVQNIGDFFGDIVNGNFFGTNFQGYKKKTRKAELRIDMLSSSDWLTGGFRGSLDVLLPQGNCHRTGRMVFNSRLQKCEKCLKIRAIIFRIFWSYFFWYN